MKKFIEVYLKINASEALVWVIRGLFTIDILPAGLFHFDHYQGPIILLLSLIGIWLHFVKWNIPALLWLVYTLLFTIMLIA